MNLRLTAILAVAFSLGLTSSPLTVESAVKFPKFEATQNQHRAALVPNEPFTFALAPAEERGFVINLKKDDVAEISWLANDELDLSLALYDPSGKNIVEESPAFTDSFPFVASVDGKYLLSIKMANANESSKLAGGQKITLQYANRINLPTRNTKNDVRMINGYEVKIIKSLGDNAKSYLIIQKNARFKKIYKGDGGIAGFYFGDDLSRIYSAADKTSALLVANTIDKTGDGEPDVQIGYYTGGAHCCVVTLFFELGNSVKVLPSLFTNNAELRAIGKTPLGGLRFETSDDTFAYWLASFAESPLPRVVLEFRRGVLGSPQMLDGKTG